MDTTPLSLSEQGQVTFHLDGEFSQQTLQLRFNGAHVLRKSVGNDVRSACPCTVARGISTVMAVNTWHVPVSREYTVPAAARAELRNASGAWDSWGLDEHVR